MKLAIVSFSSLQVFFIEWCVSVFHSTKTHMNRNLVHNNINNTYYKLYTPCLLLINNDHKNNAKISII